MDGYAVSDVRFSCNFGVVCNTLLTIDATCLSVYTDGSLSGLGTIDMKAGAAIFFEDINLDLGVGVSGLVFSIMTELQAIALALKCVPSSHSIDLFLDSQATLDAYESEFLFIYPNFRNHCWIECCHITTIIRRKNLDVNWVKIKDHSGVSSNKHANAFAKNAVLSAWRLPHLVSEHFLCANVNQARWKVGVGSRIVADSLCANINWFKSSLVWHTDSHLVSSFTSMCMASCHTYFMKAFHYWLPVAVHKHLYDRRYSSVVCLFCGDVEILDYIFLCPHNATGHACLLDAHALTWKALFGLSCSSSCVLQMLASCVSEVEIGVVLCKSFVFDDWFHESVSAFMERCGLILHDGFILMSISGLSVVFLAGVIRLLGVAEAFGVSFGFHKLCLFFSGIGDVVSVHIGA
ncbi:hypothetical protein G9A89_014385 [Geosiphon pyriformis]|nr:hypothetical protein G9A89_014385 [Geosiphon pyriformis]